MNHYLNRHKGSSGAWTANAGNNKAAGIDLADRASRRQAAVTYASALTPKETLEKWGSANAYDALNKKELQFVELIRVLYMHTYKTGHYAVAQKAGPFFEGASDMYQKEAAILDTKEIRENGVRVLDKKYAELSHGQCEAGKAEKLAQWVEITLPSVPEASAVPAL